MLISMILCIWKVNTLKIYKSFMHHINKDYRTLKNILKVKEPKKK